MKNCFTWDSHIYLEKNGGLLSKLTTWGKNILAAVLK